jgi:hypothetical protein
MAAASFLALALATTRATLRPTAGNMALLFTATVWLYVVREHGLVAAVLVLNLVAVLPGSTRARVLRVLGLLLLLGLAPLLDLHPPTLPTELPWWPRVDLVVDDVFSPEPQWADNAVAHGLANSHLALAVYSLGNAPFAWLWVGLACLGATRLTAPGRAALLVAVLPAAPALFIFSQPRHVLVVVPVAAALVAAAVERSGLRWRVPLLVAASLAAAAGTWQDWGKAQARVHALAKGATRLTELGQAICDLGLQGATWAGEMRAFTFCPMPHNHVTVEPTAALWNTIWATETDPGSPWEQVDLGLEHIPIWMLEIEGDTRPCSGSSPAPGSPYISLDGSPPELEPPCDEALPRALTRRGWRPR